MDNFMPQRIILNIVSYLPLRDVGRISTVNSSFHAATQNESIWQNLIHIDSLESICQNYPSISRVWEEDLSSSRRILFLTFYEMYSELKKTASRNNPKRKRKRHAAYMAGAMVLFVACVLGLVLTTLEISLYMESIIPRQLSSWLGISIPVTIVAWVSWAYSIIVGTKTHSKHIVQVSIVSFLWIPVTVTLLSISEILRLSLDGTQAPVFTIAVSLSILVALIPLVTEYVLPFDTISILNIIVNINNHNNNNNNNNNDDNDDDGNDDIFELNSYILFLVAYPSIVVLLSCSLRLDALVSWSWTALILVPFLSVLIIGIGILSAISAYQRRSCRVNCLGMEMFFAIIITIELISLLLVSLDLGHIARIPLYYATLPITVLGLLASIVIACIVSLGAVILVSLPPFMGMRKRSPYHPDNCLLTTNIGCHGEEVIRFVDQMDLCGTLAVDLEGCALMLMEQETTVTL